MRALVFACMHDWDCRGRSRSLTGSCLNLLTSVMDLRIVSATLEPSAMAPMNSANSAEEQYETVKLMFLCVWKRHVRAASVCADAKQPSVSQNIKVVWEEHKCEILARFWKEKRSRECGSNMHTHIAETMVSSPECNTPTHSLNTLFILDN
jgi:hypothetical protein